MTKPTFRAGTDARGLTENMLILTGQKGDRLDKALTLRDAVGVGLLKLQRNKASGKVTPTLPDLPDITPEWPNVEFPVTPTDVRANGAFHTITLSWAAPAYSGHSYAEILRAESDNPSLAVAVGTSLANVYSDAVGREFEAYYWVRFVNKNGQVGPLQGTAGIYAKTSPDVDSIIASADNFAIYNPATPDNPEIIFGVTDDGQVAIKEAVIKYATIQILNAEEITADYVVAGVSLTTPAITGGSLDMGNAYLEGGSAGFGLGGPYDAWGKGWNTVIYSDGSIYTNRLQAEGGYIKNMAIDNCVIGEDCIINGTLSADHIVGDVVKVVPLAQIADQTITIPAWKQPRTVVISGIEILVRGGRLDTSWATCTITANGQTRSVSVSAIGDTKDYRSAGMVLAAPANEVITVQVQISGEAGGTPGAWDAGEWSFDMLGAVVMCFIRGDS